MSSKNRDKGDQSTGPEASSFVKPRRSGYMTKLGGTGIMSNWKKRWFILDNHYIFYYTAPSDKKPCGIVCLADYSDCRKACSSDPKNVIKKSANMMVLKAMENNDLGTNLRDYYFYTDTEDEMRSWVNAICEEVRLAHQDEMTGESRAPSSSSSKQKKMKKEATDGGGSKTSQFNKADKAAFDEVTQDAATSTPLMHLTTTRPKAPKRKKPRKFCAFDEDDGPPPSPVSESTIESPGPSSPSPTHTKTRTRSTKIALLPPKSPGRVGAAGGDGVRDVSKCRDDLEEGGPPPPVPPTANKPVPPTANKPEPPTANKPKLALESSTNGLMPEELSAGDSKQNNLHPVSLAASDEIKHSLQKEESQQGKMESFIESGPPPPLPTKTKPKLTREDSPPLTPPKEVDIENTNGEVYDNLSQWNPKTPPMTTPNNEKKAALQFSKPPPPAVRRTSLKSDEQKQPCKEPAEDKTTISPNKECLANLPDVHDTKQDALRIPVIAPRSKSVLSENSDLTSSGDSSMMNAPSDINRPVPKPRKRVPSVNTQVADKDAHIQDSNIGPTEPVLIPDGQPVKLDDHKQPQALEVDPKSQLSKSPEVSGVIKTSMPIQLELESNDQKEDVAHTQLQDHTQRIEDTYQVPPAPVSKEKSLSVEPSIPTKGTSEITSIQGDLSSANLTTESDRESSTYEEADQDVEENGVGDDVYEEMTAPENNGFDNSVDNSGKGYVKMKSSNPANLLGNLPSTYNATPPRDYKYTTLNENISKSTKRADRNSTASNASTEYETMGATEVYPEPGFDFFPDTPPLCLEQAKEVLRLARVARKEAEDIRRKAREELERAEQERKDAEIIKRNALEILRMAKEKLGVASK